MTKPITLPELSGLNRKFSYNPVTGKLHHKLQYLPHVMAGDVAGYKRCDGYLQVKVLGKAYLVHRICYYMHTGNEPEFVDHINRTRDDNRFSNLRSGTHQQNMENKSDYSSNATGARNISYHKRDKVFEVTVKSNGIQRYVGRSESLDGAKQLLSAWKGVN